MQTSSDRLFAAHVALAIAAGPKILGYLPLPSDDMARQLVEKWNPGYKLLDRPKMHASIARMLGVQDATRVRGVPNAALKAKLIRPVGNSLSAGEVRDFWVRLPPADALSVLWELPQPVKVTLPVSKPAPLDELHCALLAWAGSFSSFTLGAPFSKRAPILDVVSVETVAAAYEASLIPVGSVASLRSITGDAMVSWATAPVLAILERGNRPMVTLSQGLRLYVPSTAFSPASSTSNSLLTPRFTSTPSAEPIAIDDEPAVSAALPCLNFATTPADVTCTQDAAVALPLQPDPMDLAAAILPQRLLFDPPVGNPPDYETDRIIDQLSQQHERELSRLRDEHQSQLQVLKAHHDATLQMRDITHHSALCDLRARVNGFDA